MNKYQEYWANPNDGSNKPEEYLVDNSGKTAFLLDIFKKYIDKNDTILELGCNVGRNLFALEKSGYERLNGIEINRTAYWLSKDNSSLPFIMNKSIEEGIKIFTPIDVIFTMAVLEHIPTESEFIFEEIYKKTNKYLITMEDEKGESDRHFPRNYKEVFEKVGFKQIEEIPISMNGMNWCRIFTK